MNLNKHDVFVIATLQIVLLVLFGVFGKYGHENNDGAEYPMFQDVHVMIFVGFGFLMTFLRRYGFSAVGFNFLLAALVIQWALLSNGFYDLDETYKIPITLESLLKADIASATVLISMGALLGRTSYIQLILMGVVEIAIFSANSYLGDKIFKVSDAGGSIFVHTFGAYFGLAIAYILERKKENSEVENSLESSSYTSDLFAMIGTLFLWLFWPSFNAIEVSGEQQYRAVINTYLSLAACCVTAFTFSLVLTPGHKFDMVHIQNSTLAGGVAVGTSANLMLQPYGAVIVGILAGVLSVYGYARITPKLREKIGLRDTCGVHNLHGMPGVLAGIIGAIMAAVTTENTYSKKDFFEIYPARAGVNATPTRELPGLKPGDGRSSAQQAGFQILALVVTMVIATVSGIITGLFLKTFNSLSVTKQNYHDDVASWHLPEENETNSNGNKITVTTAAYDNPSFEIPSIGDNIQQQ